jgi:RNA polymerase sigma factor (sigma-70 family)
MSPETEQFTVVYQKYLIQVKHYFERKITIAADADDLVQEVFLCYLDKIRNGVKIVNVGMWLYRLSYLTYMTYTRKKWNRFVNCDEIAAFLLEVIPSPYGTSSETKTIVNEILEKEIPGQKASLLILIGAYNYSRKDIADTLEISYEQVSRQYRSTCRVMRNALRRIGLTDWQVLLEK